jgi:hypothetical protein
VRHQFQPGNKFGKGRPKGSGLVQKCTDWIEKKGWDKLIEIAEGKGHAFKLHGGKVIEVGPSEELQFEALKLIAAYGKGKPRETVDLQGDLNISGKMVIVRPKGS